ncbi:hypothetical protein SAMN04489751_1113 [Brevibacterium sandarakinum]|uniref:Uncharacterized protein n=1 Tax=Brevibacterium sandarakinum TaxID=629680 RepID=A0A1H1P1Y5_BRESA|nr:hypothetical protein [Brevibacterium sandarakinum]SDS05214.1 hypothetical protein SAMN04489751_1113 [Brevibacterium sandarakinum]
MDKGANSSQDWLPPGALDHLKVRSDGLCWWCRERPATTGEHKYKQTDLTRLMRDDYLVWVGDEGMREIRGKRGIKRDRYGVVKFPKSLCGTCNNDRSQPFDRAYSKFSDYLDETWVRIMPGVPFEEIYGDTWTKDTLDLARYYTKHFGCRMVRSGLRVPESLRAFMDGATDMPDAHMALVTTDSVHRVASKGLTMSGDCVWTDPERTEFRGWVMAAYVGSVGVRYQWWAEGQKPDGWDSQFFHYPSPEINCFKDEQALMEGRTRQPGWFARMSQWLNRRSDHDAAEMK